MGRLLVFLLLLLMTGCARSMLPGVLMDNTVHPLTPQYLNEVYAAYPDSFVILGEVEGSASNTNVLGLFSFGNGGFKAAMDDALDQAPEAQGIVSCVSDVGTRSILGIVATSQTTVRGLAIRKR